MSYAMTESVHFVNILVTNLFLPGFAMWMAIVRLAVDGGLGTI